MNKPTLCERCLHNVVCYDREYFDPEEENNLAFCDEFISKENYGKIDNWVHMPGGRSICGNCGEYPLYDYFGRQNFSKYCPKCGTKLIGVVDKE